MVPINEDHTVIGRSKPSAGGYRIIFWRPGKWKRTESKRKISLPNPEGHCQMLEQELNVIIR
jgi:hypothetical protein